MGSYIMNDATQLPYVDDATKVVLGVPTLLSMLEPDSKTAQRVSAIEPLHTREEWSVFHRRIESIRQWSKDQDPLAVTRANLKELPDLRGLLSSLNADFRGTEGDFFLLKRFCFHAAAALVALEPLQPVCTRQAAELRHLMTRLHPEAVPSARFLISDQLDQDLLEARANAKQLRKAVMSLRRMLESAFGGVRFDLQGLATDVGKHEGSPGLKRVGAAWALDDERLEQLEANYRVAQQRVEGMVDRVLQQLSSYVVEARELLQDVHGFLTRVDQDLAKLRLCEKLGGSFVKWGTELTITQGFAIEITNPQRVDVKLTEGTVITGPNMGGKSALLRLVGLTQWCLQHGMPAPARAAEMPGVDHVVYVGGDLDTHAPGLSSFGREVRRLVQWWPARNTLWLFDELGRGTHPDEGAEIAREVIVARLERGDRVIAATHFPLVASIHGVQKLRIAGIRDVEPLKRAALGDLDVEDALHDAMNYQPVPGDTVPRDARVVARALGLPLKENT